MTEATLSLYEPELDIMAYDEAADRSVTIAVMGDELTPSERKHYAELIVKAVNAHDALVAALEFFVDSMRDDSVDDIAQFVDGMYSKAMSALGMFPNGDSREAAK